MDIEKLIERLSQSHSPVSLNEFKKVSAYFGYDLDHITGSHYIFRNWTGRKFSIPVHNNKIKPVYVRNFIKEQG